MPEALTKTAEVAKLVILSYTLAKAVQGWYMIGSDVKDLVAERRAKKLAK